MIHRVPGRVCLLGEHCDWAGGASLVVPMDRAVLVRATGSSRLRASAVLDGREVVWDGGDPGPLRFVQAVAAELFEAHGIPPTGAFHIEGDLPAGRGFSSSAAVCVALVRALCDLHDHPLPLAEQVEAAYRAEHDRCGVNCGRLDPLACAHALPLFIRFNGPEHDAEPLPAQLSLAVGSFRAPRDTAGILDTLGRHFRGDVPLRDYDAVGRVGAVRGAFEGFAAEAVRGRSALLDADLPALGRAMDACQELYEEELMANLPALRAPGLVRAVRALRAAGALGAKFSGAGGDGSVIGLYPSAIAAGAGVAALDRQGLDAFAMDVWCPL